MSHQFQLLGQKRFGPFFLTQFLGAFNDNVFKQALITLIAFKLSGEIASQEGWDSNTLINLCAALFILPFFLFSATAGQFADKLEKSTLIRNVKMLEVAIMMAAAIGFTTGNIPLLMGVLFLMGTQSTVFGPVKYGILPQVLNEQELTGGNGLVESGTYLAILIGTLVGTMLIANFEAGAMWTAGILVLIAMAGYFVSLGVPKAEATDPDLKINWNPISESWRILKFAAKERTILLSILGISWFWFLGAVYITQLPNYTRFNLGGSEGVYTLLLVLFSSGIGIGSLLCEKLSSHHVEIGLVPFGSIGLTVFGIDLFFAAGEPWTGESLRSVTDFWEADGSLRVIADVILIGVFGGLYSVPLYAIIQARTDPKYVSRVIAANNILNAFFMVGSAGLAIGLLSAGFSIPELFLVVAILNALVAFYIFRQVPLFLVRFIIWVLLHTLYRLKRINIDKLPEKGPAVIVSNHVSFIDPLILAGSITTPSRFVMYYKIYNQFGLKWFFRTVRTIPIAGVKEDPVMFEKAFEDVHKALQAGDIVTLYPEGQITYDGEIAEFRNGIERIIARDPVPVIPMAMRGLWGSFFSRYYGTAMTKPFRRIWSKIEIVVGDTIPPEEVTAKRLQAEVEALRGEWK